MYKIVIYQTLKQTEPPICQTFFQYSNFCNTLDVILICLGEKIIIRARFQKTRNSEHLRIICDCGLLQEKHNMSIRTLLSKYVPEKV